MVYHHLPFGSAIVDNAWWVNLWGKDIRVIQFSLLPPNECWPLVGLIRCYSLQMITLWGWPPQLIARGLLHWMRKDISSIHHELLHASENDCMSVQAVFLYVCAIFWNWIFPGGLPFAASLRMFASFYRGKAAVESKSLALFLLVLNAGNGWECGKGIIINNFYGYLWIIPYHSPHSLLSTRKHFHPFPTLLCRRLLYIPQLTGGSKGRANARSLTAGAASWQATTHCWLVVWTPLKNMNVNWGDYSQYMGN